jgi:hypothetical protein
VASSEEERRRPWRPVVAGVVFAENSLCPWVLSAITRSFCSRPWLIIAGIENLNFPQFPALREGYFFPFPANTAIFAPHVSILLLSFCQYVSIYSWLYPFYLYSFPICRYFILYYPFCHYLTSFFLNFMSHFLPVSRLVIFFTLNCFAQPTFPPSFPYGR